MPPRIVSPRLSSSAAWTVVCRGLPGCGLRSSAKKDPTVDILTVCGYSNTVTYHSGTPKITDSDYDNSIRQGRSPRRLSGERRFTHRSPGSAATHRFPRNLARCARPQALG
ncbi:DUF3060 domain-containing protein [Mycobacterium sp.]|uniref:DUF3060 domain-containing protein n=1 Tax=Mycobacterium sp. TaxID=1785 RepID=UPI003F9C1137